METAMTNKAQNTSGKFAHYLDEGATAICYRWEIAVSHLIL